jgi:SAM-dependent methyltransferase
MMTSPSFDHTVPFEPDRFRSAVPYYVAYRPRFPKALAQWVMERLGLRNGARVLDLGCGPGFLAVQFAALGCEAIGIDPNEEMLAEARKAADTAGLAITFRKGSSYDLGPSLGPIDLVVMGRSFHWMDRAAALAMLHRIVTPEGGLALFDDEHIDCSENSWDKALDAVRKSFAGPNAYTAARDSGAAEPHEAMLMASPFQRLERIGLIERSPLTSDVIVGRAYSLSNTSPEKLGDKQPAFEVELRRRLGELLPTGEFTELIELSALIATRPR